MSVRRRISCALVGVAALAACGDARPAEVSLRVEIAGHPADRPWPLSGFRLRRADGVELPLVAVPGTPPDAPVLEARGAPGPWAIVAPTGWGAFGGGQDTLDLRADVPPPKIGFGRPRTIYAWPPAGHAISSVVTARADATSTLVPSDVVISDDGAAAIRPLADAWKDVIVVHAIFGEATFASPAPVAVTKSVRPDEPWAIRLATSVSAPVAVRLVRGPDDADDAKIPLMARLATGPIRAGFAVPVGRDGTGLLETVPREVSELGFHGRGSEVWEALEAARSARDVRLFVSSAPSSARGTLEVNVAGAAGPARPVLQIRASDGRGRAGPTYAVPSFTEERVGTDGFRLRASVPAGRWRALVTVGERGVVSEPFEVKAGGGTSLPLSVVPLAVLRTTLVGLDARGFRVWDLVARRLEDDEAVEAQGFVVRGVVRPDAELRLPAGRYRLVARLDGDEGRPTELTFDAGGGQAAVDLRATK